MIAVVSCKEFLSAVRPEFSPLGESVEGYNLLRKPLKNIGKNFSVYKKMNLINRYTLRYTLLR